MKISPLLLACLLMNVSFADGITVSKSGSAYSTISAGLAAANPGDTIYVKAGVYSELVIWPKGGTSENRRIVLKGYGDGPVKIDGTNLIATQDNPALIVVKNVNYITISDIETCNFTTKDPDIFLKGIQIEGQSQHVIIKNCKIHDITTTSPSTNAGANAIGVFGTNGVTSLMDIIIDSCEVYNNKTGYSESISIDGNVDIFKVSNCHIHDNNNIGILIAGYYGESSNSKTDQARHGIICDNVVERCSSCDNPAYEGNYSADGIYSDGGGKSIFERNIVSECDIGIEAGAELSSAIDDSIIIRDNLIYKCNNGGIFIGGYETTRGWTTHCRIENNTLYMNDTKGSGTGEVLIQKSHDNIIRNNIFFTTSQKIAVSNSFNDSFCYNNIVENNLYYSIAGKNGISGISFDAHAVNADPLFVNAGTDFHLESRSPAIDGCSPGYSPEPSELDLDRNPRKNNKAVDIGAYESSAAGIKFLSGSYQKRPSESHSRFFVNVKSTGACGAFVKSRTEIFSLNGVIKKSK